MAETIYGEIPRRGGLKVRVLPEAKPLEASAELTHKDPKVRQATWTRSWLGASALEPDAIALEVGIQVLGGGFARALIELDVRDPAVGRRYARLAMAALRP